MAVQIFTPLFQTIDNSVLNVVTNGSANIIRLASPLLAICFSIYMMLIMWSYARGATDEPVLDFLTRMIAWAAILTFGLNIQYYSTYVVPFFNGLGDSLSSAINNGPTTSNVLDTMMAQYFDGMSEMLKNANGVIETLQALLFIIVLFIFCIPFFGIAAAYIVLAKLALGILLALGPVFIAMALFPATRRFFDAWTAQCLNYTFLTLLFNYATSLEIQFMQQQLGITQGGTATGLLLTVPTILISVGAGVAFIFVALNLPSLASALAGGVGISSMTGKIAGGVRSAVGAGQFVKGLGKGGGGGGGNITGE